MTAPRLAELAQRREYLIAKSARQRLELAGSYRNVQLSAGLVERAWAVLTYVRERPVLLIGLSAAMALLQRRGASKWLSGGWMAWRASATLRNLLRRAALRHVFRPKAPTNSAWPG
jgi:hypothetical protein